MDNITVASGQPSVIDTLRGRAVASSGGRPAMPAFNQDALNGMLRAMMGGAMPNPNAGIPATNQQNTQHQQHQQHQQPNTGGMTGGAVDGDDEDPLKGLDWLFGGQQTNTTQSTANTNTNNSGTTQTAGANDTTQGGNSPPADSFNLTLSGVSLFNDQITPDAVRQSLVEAGKSGQINLMNAVPKEDLDKLVAGDMTALPAVIQAVASNAMQEAVLSTMRLVQAQLPTLLTGAFGQYNRQYEQRAASTSLRKEHGDNKVTSMLAQVFASRYAKSHPNASASEIKEQASQAVKAMQKLLTAKAAATTQGSTNVEMDWDTFAN